MARDRRGRPRTVDSNQEPNNQRGKFQITWDPGEANPKQNPNDRNVQSQPYIILESREIARLLRKRARKNGSEDWDSISPDDDNTYPGAERRTDDKATKLFFMWRDEESGEIWGYECAQHAEIRKPWRLGIRLYPIVWLNWDYVADSYHGQAMLTGLMGISPKTR